MITLTDYQKGNYSFLFGSLLFTLDTIKKKPISKPCLAGCMFFNLGCVYFLKDSYKSK